MRIFHQHTTLICDLDDLLVNSGPLHFRAFGEALNSCGHSTDDITAEIMESFYGRRVRDIIDTIYDLLPDITLEREDFLDRRDQVFSKLIAYELEPMPGLDTFLHRFRRLPLVRCLASSGRKQYIDIVLEKSTLNAFFHHVISGDDVTRGKPDPEIFLKAASRAGSDPTQCVVLEDAPHGITAAKAAGMRCIAVRNPFVERPLDLSQADIIVGSLAEVTEEMLET